MVDPNEFIDCHQPLINYRHIMNEAAFGSSTLLFADFLSKHPVSHWADFIESMEYRKLKLLFPNNAIIAQFIISLGQINYTFANPEESFHLQNIFLNSLGSKFDEVFPNELSFPNLLTKLNVMEDFAWLKIYVPHIQTLSQLEPLFTVLPTDLRFQLILELGDRIYSLDEPIFHNGNKKIETILANSTRDLIFWQYFRENHAVKIKEYDECTDIFEIIKRCLQETSQKLDRKLINTASTRRAKAVVLELRVYFETGRPKTLQEYKDKLLSEILKLQNNSHSTSMQLILCYNLFPEHIQESVSRPVRFTAPPQTQVSQFKLSNLHSQAF